MKSKNSKPEPVPVLSGRVMFLNLPQRLDDKQLRAAFSALDAEDPRWVGMQQIIAEEMAGATMDFSAPDITDSKRAHGAGQVAALSTLLNRLLELRA
jgi:hypothetical protein